MLSEGLCISIKQQLALHRLRLFYNIHLTYLQVSESFLSIHVQQPCGLGLGGKVLALSRPRPRLCSQDKGQDLRCQGQGFHEMSSRILKAKATSRGRQDWLNEKRSVDSCRFGSEIWPAYMNVPGTTVGSNIEKVRLVTDEVHAVHHFVHFYQICPVPSFFKKP